MYFLCFKFLVEVLFEYKIFTDNYILTFINLTFFLTVDLLVNFTQFFSYKLFNNHNRIMIKKQYGLLLLLHLKGLTVSQERSCDHGE